MGLGGGGGGWCSGGRSPPYGGQVVSPWSLAAIWLAASWLVNWSQETVIFEVVGLLSEPFSQGTPVLRLDVTGPASTHYSALTAALRLVPLLLPESDPTNRIPPCM